MMKPIGSWNRKSAADLRLKRSTVKALILRIMKYSTAITDSEFAICKEHGFLPEGPAYADKPAIDTAQPCAVV